MTVKVLLNTRNPKTNERLTLECEFTRVPTVGEHIWLVDSGYYTQDCYKVVYVAHMPFFTGLSECHYTHSAQVYAVEVDVNESVRDTDFFS
ncbi:MAG: hypothetical protein M3N42_10935 [Cyanobacteriota bacterium]|nr:hypothetical protein [Cyanobacteriota bacterium]